MSDTLEKQVGKLADWVGQIDALKAELIAFRKLLIRSPSPTEWFPESTAPKDGTIIMIWPPSRPGIVTCAAWCYGEPFQHQTTMRWVRSDELECPIAKDRRFTHWSPVPSGPNVEPDSLKDKDRSLACLRPIVYEVDSTTKIMAVQSNGILRWVVRRQVEGLCLNKSGNWVLEPNPSNRENAFIERTRFASVEEALDAYKKRLTD